MGGDPQAELLLESFTFPGQLPPDEPPQLDPWRRRMAKLEATRWGGLGGISRP